MAKQETGIKLCTRTKANVPRLYSVIIYNDDTTTMEFVVKLLMQVFFKPESEARRLMLTVHKTGQGIAGVYTYDIAKSKVHKATEMARKENFPLRLSYKPE